MLRGAWSGAAVAIGVLGLLAAGETQAYDSQRFDALRGAQAARAADPVGLAALGAFEGADLEGADGPMARAGLDLALLYYEHADYIARGRPGAFASTVRGARVANERVLVEAVAETNGATLLGNLTGIGLENGGVEGRIVSGWLPLAALDEASRVAELRFVQPAYVLAHTGAATSQGETALAAALARQAYGVDGGGVAVAVISDSFNCTGGFATDIATADLPATIAVIEEIGNCSGARDEGRAMLQIVHDLAPGAALAFRSGFNGTANFAAGVGALVAAGAHVIVDDVGILTEPMFQDGPIAQAIDSAVAQGAAYFASAGNSARLSYEALFDPYDAPGSTPLRHDFDPGAARDTLQAFRLSAGGSAYIVLQWDQPFFSVSGGSGAVGDLDLLVYNGGTPIAQSGQRNLGGDAVDIVVVENTSVSEVSWDLAIQRFSGTMPARIKYVAFVLAGSLRFTEYATNSATVFGHANAAGARAVGAANYWQTPGYGVTPAALAAYSSRGGTTLRLGTTGAPLVVPRRKPEIVAVDGVDTRFFGSGDADGNGYPNFFGTSAAAPHAAAIAALGRSLDAGASPAALYAALLEGALDIGAPGYDDDSGAGLVQADRALAALAANVGAATAIGFAAEPSGAALASPFPGDTFASLGVTIADSDAAVGTSQVAIASGASSGIRGAFLHLPASTAASWIDLALDPPGRGVSFDFATPGGQVTVSGFDAAGTVVHEATSTGTASFVGPDGGTWLAGSVALPESLHVARVRVRPLPATAALAVDNVQFTTAALTAAADVPIPLPALLAAAVVLAAGGWRRLTRA